MRLYTVYDVIMKEFAPPFVAKNDDVAVRNYIAGAKRIPNINDLRLYMIGEWCAEDLNAPVVAVVPVEIPVKIGGNEE